MFEDNESANANLTNGVKIAILAAVPFILLGVYFLIVPISDIRTTSGAVFGCGTAISAPSDKFGANVCGGINSMYLYRGLISIAIGAVIAGAGFVFFGSKASTSSSQGPGDANGGAGPSRSFD